MASSRREVLGRYAGVLALAAAMQACGGTDTASTTDAGVARDVALVDVGTVLDAADVQVPRDADDAAVDAGAADGASLDGGADASGDAGGVDAAVADAAVANPRAGMAVVAAGALLRSTNFQMVSTLGGPSVQQTTSRSPNYRLRGGLTAILGAR